MDNDNQHRFAQTMSANTPVKSYGTPPPILGPSQSILGQRGGINVY